MDASTATLTEQDWLNYQLQYPAVNANSIYVPYNTTVEMYNNGNYQGEFNCGLTYDSAQCLCQRFTPDYDYVKIHAHNQVYNNTLAANYNYQLQKFTDCINYPGNSEEFCSAYDKCYEQHVYNDDVTSDTETYCEQHWTDYVDPNWQTGTCWLLVKS